MARKKIVRLNPGSKKVSLLMDKKRERDGKDSARRVIHNMLIKPNPNIKRRLIATPLDPKDPHLLEWLKRRAALASSHLKQDYVRKLEGLRKEAHKVDHSFEYDIDLDKDGRPRLYLAYDTQRFREGSPRRRQVISKGEHDITVESYWDNPDRRVEDFHKKISKPMAMKNNHYSFSLTNYDPYNELGYIFKEGGSPPVFYRMIDETLKHYRDIMAHFK